MSRSPMTLQIQSVFSFKAMVTPHANLWAKRESQQANSKVSQQLAGQKGYNSRPEVHQTEGF